MWRGKVGEGGGGGGGEGWSGIKKYETRKKVQKGTKLEEEVKNLKEKIRKYATKHCFAVSRNNSKNFFRIFVFFLFRETI